MKRAFVLLSSLLVVAAAPPSLQVSGAWVRESNPASRITAAYLTLHNPSSKPMTVAGVTSTAAGTVEMHEMKTVDGVMSMQQVSKIVVPAKGSVTLAPNGMHLMLIDLVAPLRGGQSVELVLKMDDGSPVVVHAPVKKQ